MKGLSGESIKPSTEPGSSFSPKLKRIYNSKIVIEFKGCDLKKDKATFTQRNLVNLFIVHELDLWSKDLIQSLH